MCLAARQYQVDTRVDRCPRALFRADTSVYRSYASRHFHITVWDNAEGTADMLYRLLSHVSRAVHQFHPQLLIPYSQRCQSLRLSEGACDHSRPTLDHSLRPSQPEVRKKRQSAVIERTFKAEANSNIRAS